MAPSFTDPQTEREWIAAIARDLAHIRGDVSDFRADMSIRMERVETRVGDAMPDLAHRVHHLEEAHKTGVTRREAWIASTIGAAAAGVVGWLIAVFTGHQPPNP
jgi:hypothetical protein